MKLREIPGQKIRRQYFNVLLFGENTVILAAMLFATVWLLLGKSSLSEWLEGWFTAMIFLVPLYLLSLLNRFFFGKTVCVLNEEGIFYTENKEVCRIPWEDVTHLYYEPQTKGRLGRWCKVEVIGDCGIIAAIPHAPYMMMHRAKRFKKDLKIGLDPDMWKIILIGGIILLAAFLFEILSK
ncbi:MAG: hypothetical protein IJ043_08560 [Clostridia bacterium]|nr:hypothetical protein [Clostridia bacterium]